jgi:two-component system, NarL family, response regulator NreC
MNLFQKENHFQSNEIISKKDVKTRVITIVLAEELASIRQNQRSLFELHSDIKVIGEVNNGLDALDMIGTLHPDILILGLTASNTLEIVRLVNQRFPRTGIIVPFKPGNDKHIQEILRYGVKACILKASSNVSLLNAVREWGNNQIHLNESELKDMPKDFLMRSARDTSDAYDVLTPREREVFNLVVKGLTNAAIAVRLSISRRTVEVHRHNLLRKLGLRNQQEQLINYAVDRGISM